MPPKILYAIQKRDTNTFFAGFCGKELVFKESNYLFYAEEVARQLIINQVITGVDVVISLRQTDWPK